MWKRRLKLAGIPSTVFAAIVFCFGWMSVSPFASWPLGLITMLCLPALIPFVLAVKELAPRQSRRRIRNSLEEQLLPTPPFRWRDVLTPRQAIFTAALGFLVVVSFALAINNYRGSPTSVNGQLVFTDHGKVIAPASERQVEEARTTESRMFTGHLMFFGVVGQLINVPITVTPSRNNRPASQGRRVSGRPGGPRRSQTKT